MYQITLNRKLRFQRASHFIFKGLIFSIPLFFCVGFKKAPCDNWTCPKCGYRNLEGISKCGICGTPDSLR